MKLRFEPSSSSIVATNMRASRCRGIKIGSQRPTSIEFTSKEFEDLIYALLEMRPDPDGLRTKILTEILPCMEKPKEKSCQN